MHHEVVHRHSALASLGLQGLDKGSDDPGARISPQLLVETEDQHKKLNRNETSGCQ